jgi:two-component system, NarL family, response regulator DevR
MVLEAQATQQSKALIHVLLVDQEVVIRAGMRALVDSWSISRVVGEVDGLRQALEVIDTTRPDVVIYSHSGRSNGFFDGLRVLVERVGQIPVVVMTGAPHRRFGIAALQAGAKWIVSKKQAATELQRVLERVQSGDWNEGVAITTRLSQMYRHDSVEERRPASNQSLTGREREVAVLVSQGCSNKQVGTRLGITEVTVRHHLTSIFNKLEIANRFELIAWLYRRRIVTPHQIS